MNEKIRAWPRCLKTWELNIIMSCTDEWYLLADVKPDLYIICEYAHIPQSYESSTGTGTWNGLGFFSYPEGVFVSDPKSTYWRNS